MKAILLTLTLLSSALSYANSCNIELDMELGGCNYGSFSEKTHEKMTKRLTRILNRKGYTLDKNSNYNYKLFYRIGHNECFNFGDSPDPSFMPGLKFYTSIVLEKGSEDILPRTELGRVTVFFPKSEGIYKDAFKKTKRNLIKALPKCETK